MIDLDFGARLGASEAASIQRIAIYLPDRDKHRALVAELDEWINRVIYLLTDINKGTTRLPFAQGSWREEEITIVEQTAVVYSFIRDPERFVERFDEIVALLHRFGRETQQNAVMVEFSGGNGETYFHHAYFIHEQDYLYLDAM